MSLLSRWLRGAAQYNSTYGHILFEEAEVDLAEVVNELRPYFESAHLDAREFFHRAARVDLHPDAHAPGAHAQYPGCLPATAQKGLFGEVMAGLLTQAYQLIGSHHWSVPIFLFRFHAEVGAYIFDLARDPARTRQVGGRQGNDFIALGIDPTRKEVVRFLAGEAKWRTSLTPSELDALMLGQWVGEGADRVRKGDGVWAELNRALPVPQGLEQLQRLLREKAADDFAEVIVSLDRALLLSAAPLPRTDLVLVAGNRAARRAVGTCYLPVTAPPAEYTAARPLQVIELVLESGERLIDALYRSLWSRR